MTLVGPNDEFLKRLEDALDADILVRGNEIHLAGHPADLADAGDILSEMITIIRTGQGLSADDVDRVVAMTRNGEGPAEIMTADILSNRGRTVRPKTLNQKNGMLTRLTPTPSPLVSAQLARARRIWRWPRRCRPFRPSR
ncbi:ATPase [Cutibacterium acnes JCM 18916]|nr:ATPase [Cutibacterium acnes JCM 18916]